MSVRHFSGIIVYLIFVFTASAEEILINPSHPAQYTVVRGDTLWTVAGKFLQHPWQWPYLWQTNTQIADPNLIYPGDTLYFSTAGNRPQLTLTRSPSDSGPAFTSRNPDTCIIEDTDGRRQLALSADGRLRPCIRTRSAAEAVDIIPVSAIAKYLSSPKVVSANELDGAPYVIGFAGEHIVAGSGDKIYARAVIPEQGLTYLVYRTGQTYRNPETGEILGYEAQHIADTRLEQTGDPATLLVFKSGGEIRMGDKLMLNTEDTFTLNYFPKPPAQKIAGNIISVLGGVSQIGLYNVVVLDKGVRDGLATGHELTVWRRGRIVADPYRREKREIVRLPDEKAGILMVFRPFERVSYALVMAATQAIHLLDKAETP